jgi:hypothetical protein
MTTFTDVQFMTADEKRRVATAWRRFLQTLSQHYGDEEACFRAFTEPLYHHLIQHCSFIAHYNRLGFYGHYFQRGDDTLRFLRQFDAAGNPDGLSTEYHDPWWLRGDYADINEAMREIAAEFVPGITEAATHYQRQQDLQHARSLAGRYGLTVSSS